MREYKKTIVSITAGAMVLFPGLVVLAQDSSLTAPMPPLTPTNTSVAPVGTGESNEVRQKEMEAQREANKKEMETQREANKKEVEVQREANKKEVERLREAKKMDVQTLREVKKKEMENLKESLNKELELLKENRQKVIGEMKDIRSSGVVFGDTTQSVIKERLDILKKNQEMIREQFKQEAEKAREEMKQIREKAREEIKTREEEVKNKIEQLRDEQKKNRASNIISQLEKINKTETDHFFNVLEKDSAVLVKIKARADKGVVAGRDVSAADTAIAAAQVAIDSAKVAVSLQAAKTYIIDPTTIPTADATTNDSVGSNGEYTTVSAFRSAFKNLHEQLKNDLKILRENSVKVAHEAIRSALNVLKNVPQIDNVNASATEQTQTTEDTSNSGNVTQ